MAGFVDVRQPIRSRRVYASLAEMPSEVSRLHSEDFEALHVAKTNAIRIAAHATGLKLEKLEAWFKGIRGGFADTWFSFGDLIPTVVPAVTSELIDLEPAWTYPEAARISLFACFDLVCIASPMERPEGGITDLAFAATSSSKFSRIRIMRTWALAQALTLQSFPSDNADVPMSIDMEGDGDSAMPPTSAYGSSQEASLRPNPTTFTLKFGQQALQTAKNFCSKWLFCAIPGWAEWAEPEPAGDYA